MKAFTQHVCATLIGIAVFSSCSRPVAYFQRGPVQHYGTAKTEVAPSVAASEVTSPVEAQASISEPAAVAPAPAQQVAQAKQAMTQLEAYVRNDNKLASNKKLTNRIARINEQLATASTKNTLMTSATSAKKTTLVERLMLKKIDKKIKNHVAPDKTNYLNKNLKNGIIIGAVGLILSLVFSGVIGVIGLVLLIVGVALILLGVLQ